jgi:hypothetical protein
VPETIGPGDLLHCRPRIGDSDEAAARFIRTDGLLHSLEKVLLENVCLLWPSFRFRALFYRLKKLVKSLSEEADSIVGELVGHFFH